MSSSGKFFDLWLKQRSTIKDKLEIAATKQSIQLNPEEFKKVGNRVSYSFNLEFIDGIVVNNVDGTAVARDLAKVLENSTDIKELLKEGHYKINMDRRFCLWIQKK